VRFDVVRGAAPVCRRLSELHSDEIYDDFERLARFFDELPTPIDHVMVAAGAPYYAKLTEIDFARARGNVEQHFWLPLHILRFAIGKVRPGGTLCSSGGRAGDGRPRAYSSQHLQRRCRRSLKSLALELAPIRVNLIAPGFVDTPLSASLLGDQLDARREQLRTTLPIRRVVGPADVAALAIHLMSNTAITGATYDIDGGQQLVDG
jgi:NAD(P)-dependent dehydrogenase (short-subunit alcohol dehydrogenase family)